MAKRVAKATAHQTQSRDSSSKAPTIFTLIKYLTSEKRSWDVLTSEEKKAMDQYMLNRFFSMNPDLLELVASIQMHTVGKMSDEMVYTLYYYLLPNIFFPMKYIKSSASEKYNSDLVAIIADYLQTSKVDAIYALETILSLSTGKEILSALLESHAKTPEQIKKLLK